MQHTIQGSRWVLLARSMGWGRTFVRTVVLARWLAPHDFGLFGVTFLLFSLLETISRTGLWGALIHKKGDIAPYLDTVWTLGLIRGVLITSVLFCFSPALASFFKAPEAQNMIRIIGCAVLFQSLCNIGTVYFDKTLDYAKYFQLLASSALADLGVTLVAAFFFHNAWALVAGCLAGELALCLMSYVLHPYRPRPELNLKKARELLLFGRWIWGSGVLGYVATRADDLFVGKILGVVSLGYYQMAYSFTNLISTEIIFPLLKVTFPAYAMIQDDLLRLKDAYIKVLTVISALSLFMAMILFVLAEALIPTLLGETWLPVTAILRILVFAGCLRAWQRSLVQMAKALGRPRFQTECLVIQLAVFSMLIYPAARYLGAPGVALVVFTQSLVSLPWLIRRVHSHMGLSYAAVLRPVIHQGAAAIITGFLLTFLNNHLPIGLLSLFFKLITGSILYACLSLLFSKEIAGFVKSIVQKKEFSHVR